MGVIVTDEERVSWTTTDKTQESSDEVRCECVGISLSENMIMPKGYSKPILATSFVMKLVEINTGEEITCYFKYQKSRKGHPTIKPDSKLAKLHRLTTGIYNRKRYSNAGQLANHLIGEEFLVQYEIETTQKHDSYRKTTVVKPVVPMVSEQWTSTGKLRAMPRRKSPAINRGNIEETLRKSRGNTEEKLRIEKAEDPHSYLGLPAISTAYKGNRVQGLEGTRAHDVDIDTQSIPVTDNTASPAKQRRLIKEHKQELLSELAHDADKYKTTIKQINKMETSYQYYQRPDETEEQYHDRVVDECEQLSNR